MGSNPLTGQSVIPEFGLEIAAAKPNPPAVGVVGRLLFGDAATGVAERLQ